MRVQQQPGNTGYTMRLSERDTHMWAHKSNAMWPCSDCSDHRIVVCVDSNGLCDFAMDGKSADMDGTELAAIVAGYLPADLRHLWPCWEKT
jgi:hypothetical protein